MQRIILAAALASLLAAFPAFADDSVGMVKTVSGVASIVADGQSTAAVVGAHLYRGNVLKTGADGTMGITFNDDTVMSFGPDTEVSVDDFVYAPSEGKLKLEASISRGTLEYVSGVIAKLKPQAVAIKTPTGTIGVRGTRFVVKGDE